MICSFLLDVEKCDLFSGSEVEHGQTLQLQREANSSHSDADGGECEASEVSKRKKLKPASKRSAFLKVDPNLRSMAVEKAKEV